MPSTPEPNLEELSREDLLALVKQLSAQTRKFGLVWEDKPEKVAIDCETKLPVLVEDGERHIERDCDATDSLLGDDGANLPTHLIIEGDNYHALSVLNYTHAGKVDVIYIDPPYNTGAKDWTYNNDYVDREDTYRHSKWLSFMQKRLILAKNLLTENGVLICAIDENELHTLGLLLEEIFGQVYEYHCIAIVHNPRGIQGTNFSYINEFAFFVVPKGKKIIGGRKIQESCSRRSKSAAHGG